MIKGVKFLLFGFIFGVIETIYFGGNLTPSSNGEIICDIISLSLSFYGISLITKSAIES